MSLDTRPGLPDLDLARILLAVDVWMASSNGQQPSAHNSESIRTAPKLSWTLEHGRHCFVAHRCTPPRAPRVAHRAQGPRRWYLPASFCRAPRCARSRPLRRRQVRTIPFKPPEWREHLARGFTSLFRALRRPFLASSPSSPRPPRLTSLIRSSIPRCSGPPRRSTPWCPA